MMQVALPDIQISPLVIRPPRTAGNAYFELLCAANPDLRIERTADGEILIMAPAGGETGYRNNEISAQLRNWAKLNGTGIAFDSSTGFALADGANRSPDASWVERGRLTRLSREQKRLFLPLCPDFVIELRSPSDRVVDVKNKMDEWMNQGAKLGWLIDPDEQSVSIYRPQSPPETLHRITRIEGESPVSGFVLELEDIWKGL